ERRCGALCDGVAGLFFFSSRRRHTRFDCDWSSDVCSSDLKLTSRLRALKDVRDRLAHHSAFKSEIPAKFFKLTTIAPSPYDVRAKSMRYKPISPLEIGQFIITVTDVAKELAALVNEMEKIK